MPYKELQHTADWSLHVWAPSLSALFSEAAHGMNHLAGMTLKTTQRDKRFYKASPSDPEALLVSFLSELVFIAENEKFGFDEFKIDLSNGILQASMTGAPIRSINRGIKAVTYHNLKIHQDPGGYSVEIVFDV